MKPHPATVPCPATDLFALSSSEAFFAPLAGLTEASVHARSCPELPDAAWLHLGIARTLHAPRSGRGFLQTFAPHLPCCPQNSHFFETLKSPRRSALVAEVSAAVAKRVPALEAALPEALANFDLYAGDGHWHEAAIHDAPIDQRRWAVGHLYGLSLRSHALSHLDLAVGKKEHDMGAIKRLGAAAFRPATAKGRKTLWVWDRAGIDFKLWHYWKSCHGIYFISRVKENMCLEVVGQPRPEPDHAPFNAGVLADELARVRQFAEKFHCCAATCVI
jgi:hypothetical protein